MSQNESAECHVCRSELDFDNTAIIELPVVTSDCRVWDGVKNLTWCENCGNVVQRIDQAWLDATSLIYDTYSLYHQSGGQEQRIFNASKNAIHPRSKVVARNLLSNLSLPLGATVLDIGSGSGAMLRGLGQVRDDLQFWANDLTDHDLNALNSIAGFQQLYVGDIKNINRKFDLITLHHVMEHLVNPAECLMAISKILNPNGFLFIQVPNYVANPFDLIIYDHCTHFSVRSICNLLKRCGFSADIVSTDWLKREISVVAMPSDRGHEICRNGGLNSSSFHQAVDWLLEVQRSLDKLASGTEVGVFGASIAGLWSIQSNNSVGYVVDEDPTRIGQSLFGRPIFGPNDLKGGSKVFVPLAFEVSKEISCRLSKNSVDFVCVPEFPLSSVI